MKFMPRTVFLPLLVFGLLAYLVSLVLTFPAERAYSHWQASEYANKAVALSGISGSVWSGKASMAMIQGQPMENVEWTVVVVVRPGGSELAFSVAGDTGNG